MTGNNWRDWVLKATGRSFPARRRGQTVAPTTEIMSRNRGHLAAAGGLVPSTVETVSLPPRPGNTTALEAYEKSRGLVNMGRAMLASTRRIQKAADDEKLEEPLPSVLVPGAVAAGTWVPHPADRSRNFRSRKINAMMTEEAQRQRERQAEERQREREEWMRERNERERRAANAEAKRRRNEDAAREAAEAARAAEEKRLRNEDAARQAKSITSQAFHAGLRRRRGGHVLPHAAGDREAGQKALNANEQRRAANAAARKAHSVHNAHMSRMFTNVHEILNKQEAEAKRRRNEAEAKRNEARSAAKKRSGFWRVATAATAGLALSAGYRPTTHAGNGIPPSHRSPTVFRNHGYAGTVSLTSPTSPMSLTSPTSPMSPTSPVSPTYAPVVRPRSALPNYRPHRQVAASIEGPDFREVLNSRGPAPGTSVVRPRSALPNYRSSAQGPDSPSTRSSTLGDESRWAMNFGSKGWRRDASRGPPRRKR